MPCFCVQRRVGPCCVAVHPAGPLWRSVPRRVASCCGVLCFGPPCRVAFHCGALRCGVPCCLVLCHGGSLEVSLARVVVRSAGRSVAGWWRGGAVRCWWLAGSVLWGSGCAARAGGPGRCLLDCCCGLFLGNSTCTPVPLCFSKSEIQNPKSTNLAGSLDGAPTHNTSSKTKTLFRDRSILQRSFTVGIRCFFIIDTLQCDFVCDLRLARCCAAAVPSHNTSPPLRPRRDLTHLGGRHNVEFAVQDQKSVFWTSTCVGYRSITVVGTHTLRCSHGIPVVSASFIRRVRLCHGCVLAEAAEDNFARHTARALYQQQGCGHVEP